MFAFHKLIDQTFNDLEMYEIKLDHPYKVEFFCKEFAEKSGYCGRMRVICGGETVVKATYNLGLASDLQIRDRYKKKWIRSVTGWYSESKGRMNLYIHV